MTPSRIAELRALLAAAKPGPWPKRDFFYTREDAVLIAAARTALPDALDALEAARKEQASQAAEIERLRAVVEECVADPRIPNAEEVSPCRTTHHACRCVLEENARLRAKLHDVDGVFALACDSADTVVSENEDLRARLAACERERDEARATISRMERALSALEGGP